MQMQAYEHQSASCRLRQVGREILAHSPFTLLGASTGLLAVLLLGNTSFGTAHGLFMVFHPAHVLFSALVTTSLYRLRQGTKNLPAIIAIGYLGSVGIATLSDCVLPFFGEQLLGVPVPTEAAVHGMHADKGYTCGLHLGFIEDWYVVNPAALAGIALAYVWPHTKLPHAIHILLSTWASAAHILMNLRSGLSAGLLLGILVVLFIAVWVPCCVSDIVFPMLFVKPKGPSDETGCQPRG